MNLKEDPVLGQYNKELKATQKYNHVRQSLTLEYCVVTALMAAVLCGCAREETAECAKDREWDRVCAELKAKYERGREEVVRKCESYEATRFGDERRVTDMLGYTADSFDETAWRHIEVRGAAGVGFYKRVAAWLNGERNKPRSYDGGSYSGIISAHDRISLCERAVEMMMMPTETMRRWERISSAAWRIKDRLIVFDNGSAEVNLPWRIFDAKAYDANFAWALYFRPEDTFTCEDKDYAIVRFTTRDCLVGWTTTTEESMLLEVDGAIVKRVIGLHNYLHGKAELDSKSGRVTLNGEGGGGSGAIRFVIDLKTMKVLKGESVLPSNYAQDGYEKLFVDAVGC